MRISSTIEQCRKSSQINARKGVERYLLSFAPYRTVRQRRCIVIKIKKDRKEMLSADHVRRVSRPKYLRDASGHVVVERMATLVDNLTDPLT